MSNKNEQQTMEEEIKEIDADLKKLSEVKKFDDFWRIAEKILADSPMWRDTEGLLAGKNVKEFVGEFFSGIGVKTISNKIFDNKEEGEHARALSKKILEYLQKNDYFAFGELVLSLVLQYIAESKGIKTPDNVFDLDIEKVVLPVTPDSLFLPLLALCLLIMRPEGSKSIFYNLSPKQGDDYIAFIVSVLFETTEVLMIESDLNMINLKRKKRIDEFTDCHHKAMDRYYDIIENSSTVKKAKKQLEEIIEEDPDFFDSRIELADILLKEGDYFNAKILLRSAFLKAMAEIVDYKGRWPKSMSWSWLENRHIIRALNRWAFFLWEDGRPEYAIEIFRKLLRSNPNDNIGARYEILAILMNYEPYWAEEMFPASSAGFVDAIKEMEWFSKNVKNFPDEFDWWLNGAEDV